MKTIIQATYPAFNPSASRRGSNAAEITPQAAPRFDLYSTIHKAIRVGLGEMQQRLGALDLEAEDEVRLTADALVDLLDLLRAHLGHENRFLHAAMELRRPGSAEATAHEHVEHEAAIDALQAQARALAATAGVERATLARELYRRFALFAAENLVHMHHEETVHNAVLWATHSDAELLAIHQAILGCQTPLSMARWLHWLAPALGAIELAPMLDGLRASLPADAFADLLARVAARQNPLQHARLRRALGLTESSPEGW